MERDNKHALKSVYTSFTLNITGELLILSLNVRSKDIEDTYKMEAQYFSRTGGGKSE